MYSLIHNLAHENILYILDWVGYEWQALAWYCYREEDNYDTYCRHAKQRILDSMSDQDIWAIMKDKNREWDERVAKFFERELNHRKNPNQYVKDNLNELKEQIDILTVVEHYIWSFRFRPRQLIKCPFPDHQDWTASLLINTKNNTFKCFGCQKWWSQVDFIMWIEKCDLKTAINKFKQFK